MTTIINSPGNGEDTSGVMSLVVGVIILLVVGALFFMYVLPAIRNASTPNNGSIDVNVKLPEGNGGQQPQQP